MSVSQKSKRATLRDVARHAHVSVATVSRVLNNSALVTPETRMRVTRAIDALEFVPSAAARSLNTGRSRTIGALVPTLDHAIFARFLDALEDRLSSHGYALIVAVTGGDVEVEERKSHGLLDMGAEGLIVSGRRHAPGFDALVARFKVPTLITSYFDAMAEYPTIGYDNAAIATDALEYLRALGHRSIAVVHGSPDVNDRIATRIAAIAESAGEADVSFAPVSMDVAGGSAAIEMLEARGAMPSAILCLSDVQALGALFELQRRGISVPEDVSLMGFDNLEWSAVSYPGITSIRLPAAEMGAAAGDAIADWLETGTRAEPIALGAEIIVRGSTRAVGS